MIDPTISQPSQPPQSTSRELCLRRVAIGIIALVMIALTTGCHKKKQAARYQPPPPLRYPSKNNTEITATTRPSPPIAPPDTSTQESPWPTGKVASTETGFASWYGPPYHNRRGANGEIYDQNAMTAAHRTLPMGSIVRVTNLTTNQTAVVKITDRGPFVQGRVIDLSLAAAKATGLYRMGVGKVRIEVYVSQRADTGGKWCVQIGAFENEKNANKLKDDLLRRYQTARVIEFTGPTGHWVRINPLVSSRNTAEEIADKIHSKESDAQPYIVRLD